LPIVGDVRGEGFFYGVELVKDKATKQIFTDTERRSLLGHVSSALFQAGLYCRTDDRGDSVIQLAPPLISGQTEFDTIEAVLRSVLTDVGSRL
jgi:adenosylmethionine-8-amino-7-oxononanoate aminotransferase